MPSHELIFLLPAIQSDARDKLKSRLGRLEWAVSREVDVGIVGLHIGRAVVIVNTYEKYQLVVYIYDSGTVKEDKSFYQPICL